jgi:molybdopterin-containing oxidoreductase family membrane subunit
MMFCNVVLPQIFWFKRARTSIPIMWVVSVLVNVGMWSERFVIFVISLHHSFVPSMFKDYVPTLVDVGLLVGTIGFFSMLMLLFLKFFPAIAVSEVKELNHELAHAHVRPEANPRQTGA